MGKKAVLSGFQSLYQLADRYQQLKYNNSSSCIQYTLLVSAFILWSVLAGKFDFAKPDSGLPFEQTYGIKTREIDREREKWSKLEALSRQQEQ